MASVRATCFAMAVADPVRENPPPPAPSRKDRERDQRRENRQPTAAGDAESQEDDVPGHVRGEDAAEPEVADGVDQAGGERQHQQRPGKRMPDGCRRTRKPLSAYWTHQLAHS
jgi:hypothetical protein